MWIKAAIFTNVLFGHALLLPKSSVILKTTKGVYLEPAQEIKKWLFGNAIGNRVTMLKRTKETLRTA